ncbi:MAG: hypothetical protein AAF612_05385 [Planctomycetota bacterium]
MAEADNANAAEPAKKKPPIKMLAIVAVVMVVEAIALGAVFLMSGGPSEVQATEGLEDAELEANRPAELLVVSDKFQNTRTGKSYLINADIYVTVRSKHADEVQEQLDQRKNQLTDAIRTVFHRAEPAHLSEPGAATLKRQIASVVNAELGVDGDGEPYVLEVLLPRMHRFASDL